MRILPQAAFIRAPNGSFSAVLALDQPAENTVDVRCSLDAVSPRDELYNTSELCFGEIKDKVTFANNSVEIKLSQKEIQFQVRAIIPQNVLSNQGCHLIESCYN